jgi:hypothetical protein
MTQAVPGSLRRRILLLSGLLLLCVSLPLAAAKTPQQQPRLLFGIEDVPGMQSRLSEGLGKALLARQATVLATPGLSPYLSAHAAVGHAMRALLLRSPKDLADAKALMDIGFRQLESGGPLSRTEELSPEKARASQVAALALCYDLTKDSLSEDFRHSCARQLLASADALQVQPGRRGSTSLLSSSLALQAAASGLAALAVSDEPELRDQAQVLSKAARQAVVRHLSELGEHGWPRDGVDSLRVLLSHGYGAFLMAWRRNTGEDLFTPSPARHWASLYATLLLPGPGGLEAPLFGMPPPTPQLQPRAHWEGNSRTGGDTAALLCLTDAASRSALLWCFDHSFGSSGDSSLDIQKGSDALFLLLGAEAPETALNPARSFGRVWRDDSAGVMLLRNRWQDGNDALAAFTANAFPAPNLPSYADAGSFRLSALGGRWAVRRQQDEGDLTDTSRETENVVVIPGTHGWLGGRLLEARSLPDGSGTMLVNLDAVCSVAPSSSRENRVVSTFDIGIRARRAWSVDYSGSCGSPVLVVLVDEIQNAPTRRWLLHTEEKELRLNRNGFEIRAANGSVLSAHVITPEEPRMSIKRGRWTNTVSIDGEGHFFVIMTIREAGQAEAPLHVEGADLGAVVRLGNCAIRFDGNSIAIR